MGFFLFWDSQPFFSREDRGERRFYADVTGLRYDSGHARADRQRTFRPSCRRSRHGCERHPPRDRRDSSGTARRGSRGSLARRAARPRHVFQRRDPARRPSTRRIAALDGFRTHDEGYGVSEVRAVATSAVREARNGDTFLDRIQRRTGIAFDDHQRGGGEPAHVPARVQARARQPRRVQGRVDAARRSRRRQHQPDAAAPRRAEPLGRLCAGRHPAAAAARSAAATARRPGRSAQALHRQRHRRDPARNSAATGSRT